MFATFNCASAASNMLGKKVMKSLYSISACASPVEPPSLYQASPIANLARATYSESGYVLISVCSVTRGGGWGLLWGGGGGGVWVGLGVFLCCVGCVVLLAFFCFFLPN